MRHAAYASALAGIGLAAILGFGLYGRQLEPLAGDLTRIGWYAENDFGWQGEQRRFRPPLAEEGRLDGAYDVVALGDSFTVEEKTELGAAWPQFLARATGWRIGVFDREVLALEDYLASPGFRESPPALILWEVVERLLPVDRGAAQSPTCVAAAPSPRPGLTVKPRDTAPESFRRPVRAWDEWPAAYAMNFALKNAVRWLKGRETTNAVRLDLAERGLFSSRRDDALLVYGEDFNKNRWREPAWDTAACRLLAIQDAVQANGRTLFLAMIVPDKLTAYAPFLATRRYDEVSRLDRIAGLAALNQIPLAAALDPRAAPDLYLPNDTHWSSATHERAAALILQHLAARGVVTAAE
jgi:hypothetical protein